MDVAPSPQSQESMRGEARQRRKQRASPTRELELNERRAALISHMETTLVFKDPSEREALATTYQLVTLPERATTERWISPALSGTGWSHSLTHRDDPLMGHATEMAFLTPVETRTLPRGPLQTRKAPGTEVEVGTMPRLRLGYLTEQSQPSSAPQEITHPVVEEREPPSERAFQQVLQPRHLRRHRQRR